MIENINDLSYDLLKYILGFLSDKQLFLVERVCSKWQKCVLKLLAQKETLKRLDHYSLEFIKPSIAIEIIINDDNIEILKKILSKCKNIKALDLSYTHVIGKNNLIQIAKLCPKLESFDFCESEIDVTKDEMEEFGKLIGSQLIKCKFGEVNNFMIFFTHLKNIEKITFFTCSIQKDKQLFHHLNVECQNLKVLRWNSYREDIDYQEENMIKVMQRIQHLKVGLSVLLRFKFELNNLTELTIYPVFVSEKRVFEMTFINVTKLNIYNFNSWDFEMISKFKFPKLEHVSLRQSFYDMPTSFINQIKHIKSLDFNFNYFSEYHVISLLIPRLNQLTNLIWKGISLCDDPSFHELFQYISLHKSLENMEFEIEDFYMEINQQFFDILINFCKKKPNTKIVIKLPKQSKHEQKFFDYKNVFEEIKHLNKLNMELLFNE